MPPISATSWTTLVRRAVQTARHGVKQKAAAASANLTKARAVRLALQARLALVEAFPAITQPTYPRLALQPIPLYKTTPGAHPLRTAGLRVGSQPFRLPPHAARGGMAGNVGLGSARTFASSSTSQAAQSVHMLLRPFVGLDEKKLQRTRYQPYAPRQRRTRKTQDRKCRSIRGSLGGIDIEHYFPRIPLRAVSPEAAIPLCPEKLVTPGTNTTLCLALSPSLTALLAPTTELSFAEEEIGRSVFAGLLPGILPLSSIFASHASIRVLPLLYKLTSLGVLDSEAAVRGPTRVTLEPQMDDEGRPEVLRLTFHSRSATDVRILLGEMGGEDEWYTLVEAAEAVEESQGLYDEVADTWAEPASEHPRSTVPYPASSSSSAVDVGETNVRATTAITAIPADSELSELVMPRIDIESWQRSLPLAPPSDNLAYSWTSSSGLGSVIQDDGFESDTPPWSVTPSEADDLESFMSEMDWSEGGSAGGFEGDSEVVSRSVSRAGTPDIWMSGFGFVQPW